MALVVNGEKIEDSIIEQELKRMRPDYDRVFADHDSEERKKQLLEWSRENVIEMVLINQEAKKNGPDVSQRDIKKALSEMRERLKSQGNTLKELNDGDKEKLKDNIELQIIIDRMMADVCKDLQQPSQQAIQQFYDENNEQLKTPEKIRVSHIVKHIDAQTDEMQALNIMEQAYGQLQDGEFFETLAAQYSDCPENYGDLGYIIRGQMVEEFEDVVFNLDSDQTSGVFRTRFGFHIARVTDRKPEIQHTLEDAKETIINQLKEQMRTKAVDDFIDGLRSKAAIEGI